MRRRLDILLTVVGIGVIVAATVEGLYRGEYWALLLVLALWPTARGLVCHRPRVLDARPPVTLSAEEHRKAQIKEWQDSRLETRQIAKWGTLFFVAGVGLLGDWLVSVPGLSRFPPWVCWAPAALGFVGGMLGLIINRRARYLQGQLELFTASAWPEKLGWFFILIPIVCGLAVSLALVTRQ